MSELAEVLAKREAAIRALDAQARAAATPAERAGVLTREYRVRAGLTHALARFGSTPEAQAAIERNRIRRAEIAAEVRALKRRGR